jgi:hypothetical protein
VENDDARSGQDAIRREGANREMRSRARMVAWVAAKPKRDPSLHRPTRSQEANAEEKASACSAQDDGAAKASACVAQEANAEEKASACVAQDDGLAWWLRRTRWLGGSEGHEVRVALRGE